MMGRESMTTAALLASLLLACESPSDTATLPDWSEGYEVEDVSSDDITTMALAAPSNGDYAVRVSDLATGGECSIDPTSGYESKDCILDIPELDLFGSPFSFTLQIPQGSCEYLVYWFYQYEVWQVGTGPTNVSYEIDIDGNYVNEDGTVDGSPVCEYDYSPSGQGAPNCCLGSYTITSTYQATGLSDTSSLLYWGGDTASCYGGAAFIDPNVAWSTDGWPLKKIDYLAQSSYQETFSWEPLSLDFYSNVPLASYYDPADHDGAMPAGLAGAWAEPWYVFQCYDHAEELLGALRLQVREWNEEGEFELEGDPETSGTEAASGGPINDIMDWADVTPGDSRWVELDQ